MQKRIKQKRYLLLLLMLVISGCKGISQVQAGGEEEPKGSFIMAGSTSMEKLANATAEGFMERYPGIRVYTEFTGSSAGIEAVLEERVDLGNSSRNLKPEEVEKGAVQTPAARDRIAVITHPSNSLENLTREELADLYTGKTGNWSRLGGEDLPVVAVGREAGSGTRGSFEELLGIEGKSNCSNELDSSGAVLARVASTPGALGYVSLDVCDDTVKILSLEGVSPLEEKEYLLERKVVLVTKGPVEKQSENVRLFFRWLESPEGKEVIRDVGLIPVEE